jgi:hypothetical protein
LRREDLNDHQSLRQDPLFQVISECGIKDQLPLASASTLCRLENRVDRKALTEKELLCSGAGSIIVPADFKAVFRLWLMAAKP